MRKMKKKSVYDGTGKIHTSIYLLPRHRAYLQDLSKLSGMSMTACITRLIDDSMPNIRIMMNKNEI